MLTRITVRPGSDLDLALETLVGTTTPGLIVVRTADDRFAIHCDRGATLINAVLALGIEANSDSSLT